MSKPAHAYVPCWQAQLTGGLDASVALARLMKRRSALLQKRWLYPFQLLSAGHKNKTVGIFQSQTCANHSSNWE